ncbi:MAG: DUF1330 domain-containing protein [Actinomycetia bacterium]|nr:DUF1330 domain-containing protein [Actinomycetes bacterium]
MAAYVVFQGHVEDPEKYESYRPGAGASIAEAGGRFLARGGPATPLEGEDPPSRTVIVEFESVDAAQRWYDGAAYSAVKGIRQAASTGRMYIVEG